MIPFCIFIWALFNDHPWIAFWLFLHMVGAIK